MSTRFSAVITAAVMFTCSVLSGETGRPPTLFREQPVIRRDTIPVYDYTVVNIYPHDPSAFTQGLVYHNGFLYEGTGLYGVSSLRKVELTTGEIRTIFNLPSIYFGEGITIYRDTIVQLTWREHIGFVYEENTFFQIIDSFYYTTEGWGLTHNDTFLIMSDGTPTLYFLDPVTYDVVYTKDVTVDGVPLMNINELEYIQGMVYANIWFHDSIAMIDPENGVTVGWVNLNGILGDGDGAVQNVLNGIAFDAHDARLFVTGKLWPHLFEIQIEPVNYPPVIAGAIPASPCSVSVDDYLTLAVRVYDPDVEDTITYTWSVNDVVDPAFIGSRFVYAAKSLTIDTITVLVSDGCFSRTASWQVHVLPWYNTFVEWHPFLPFQVTCYPSPCRDRCQLVVQFGKSDTCSLENRDASLSLYSAAGMVLHHIAEYRLDPGAHDFPWDLSDLIPGTYFLECRTQQYRDVNKVIILGR